MFTDFYLKRQLMKQKWQDNLPALRRGRRPSHCSLLFSSVCSFVLSDFLFLLIPLLAGFLRIGMDFITWSWRNIRGALWLLYWVTGCSPLSRPFFCGKCDHDWNGSSVGSPQGCVPSPQLFILFINLCQSQCDNRWLWSSACFMRGKQSRPVFDEFVKWAWGLCSSMY